MIVPRQSLIKLARGISPMITSTIPFADNQFQPASLDLRLGKRVYCMRVSGLPQAGEKVRDLIDRHMRYTFELTADKSHYLEQRVWFLIELAEGLALSKLYSAKFSPKSSTGRGGVFVRVLGDMSHYDFTEYGYQGPLFLEVYPYAWPVKVSSGLPMVQVRLKHQGARYLVDHEIIELHASNGLLFSKKSKVIPASDISVRNGRLYLHLDLQRKIVGWMTKYSVVEELEMDKKEHHRLEDFFEPIAGPLKDLVVSPGRLYLFPTEERIRIPNGYCGQLDERTTEAAEGRQHIAGFFDPGFGEEGGKHGVLEYIPDANFGPERLVHGQIMAAMIFEELCEQPDAVYGASIGSHYVGDSEPQLPKFFKDWNVAWKEG